jgi:hypothetical protein
MTILQFLYLSRVTQAGIPEMVGFCGACTVAIGLAVLQMFPLNFEEMTIEERAGIVVSLTAYKAFVSMCEKVICRECVL